MSNNDVDSAMRARVCAQLRDIEQRYNVRVLYAGDGDLPHRIAIMMCGFCTFTAQNGICASKPNRM